MCRKHKAYDKRKHMHMISKETTPRPQAAYRHPANGHDGLSFTPHQNPAPPNGLFRHYLAGCNSHTRAPLLPSLPPFSLRGSWQCTDDGLTGSPAPTTRSRAVELSTALPLAPLPSLDGIDVHPLSSLPPPSKGATFPFTVTFVVWSLSLWGVCISRPSDPSLSLCVCGLIGETVPHTHSLLLLSPRVCLPTTPFTPPPAWNGGELC